MIGWYVHHHGSGHRTRALQIARQLSTPVVGFSSLDAPDGWPGQWRPLPGDETDVPDDPTAGGVLHWAPLDHQGHRDRLGLIAERLTLDLSLMVVDTSAEVTLLARLFGVPTAVMAMRGDRTDRPHLAAYDAAGLIIAPWSEQSHEPGWPDRWTAKTVFTGAISRFDGWEPADRTVPMRTASGGDRGRRVLVVWGAGGHDATDADLTAARAATPGWSWTIRTPGNPSPDLWQEVADADVVVTHGGQNAVAEVAAARRPAVVIAQQRPFGEQHATVRALHRLGACVALGGWPSSEQWAGLLEQAAATGGDGWSGWNHGGGASRAARALESVLWSDPAMDDA